MRWVRYEADGKVSYGILDGDEIEQVSGSPFDTYNRTGSRRAFDSVKLLAPVVPATFYAAGINYEAHVREAAKLLGQEPNLPTKADIGYRANNALIAHREPIVVPKDATEKVHYEGELVVVVGKQAKNLSEDEAFSCVLGYTIGNDVSERTWQAADRTMWRAKNTDTFKPMGPLDGDRRRPRADADHRPAKRQSGLGVRHQRYDFRHSALYLRHVTLPDPVSRGRYLDGDRWCVRRPGGRRRSRRRDQRHRSPH